MLIVPGRGRRDRRARAARAARRDAQGGLDARARARDGEVREFATGPGFFKVEQDRALALVDDAVDAREIDAGPGAAAARGGAAPSSAQLDAGESEADRWQLEQRIRHAENQLAVIGRG